MMNTMKAFSVGLAVVLLGVGAGAAAEEAVDAASLYELTSDGTSAKLKTGEAGRLVIEIRAKGGAHISDEAPLRVQLKSAALKLSNESLGLKDSTAKKVEGSFPNPRFEVPFTAAEKGAASVEASLSFFVCTEKLCSRQQKSLSVPITVL